MRAESQRRVMESKTRRVPARRIREAHPASSALWVGSSLVTRYSASLMANCALALRTQLGDELGNIRCSTSSRNTNW